MRVRAGRAKCSTLGEQFSGSFGANLSFLETIWDFLLFFLTIFVFMAYLIALWSIITDLFRDRTMSGWVKAIWLLFLIFVPFLTALVYLIARGSGMAERTAAVQRNAQQSGGVRSAKDQGIEFHTSQLAVCVSIN